MLFNDGIESCILVLPSGNRFANDIMVLLIVRIHVLCRVLKEDFEVFMQSLAIAFHIVEGRFNLR